ncbi:hypothetical protein SASPL_102069 [Salvia splendens]|uniref:Hsp70-interacting protein n=1 Tax=Salvia splendens TaxID=180675 RepID=A0A8X9AD31_SALSN|nr:hypothetical protein SASPL_102069 [Salvia splendens]
MEAMQGQTIDVIKRVKEITLLMKTPEQVLESQGGTPQDIEGFFNCATCVDMLDELQEHVESIDNANDLHSIGGLAPLLGYLRNSHPNIRAKAADVVSTVVQNNPRSQQLVMEANGMEPLLTNFTSDPDVTKALGAISSLIRHNKSGIAAFRLANGYTALRDALGSESVRFQSLKLRMSNDSDVREAALRSLLVLARDRSEKPATSSEDDDKLKQILQDRIRGISEMSGFLSLLGEDAPPPDVASLYFQPALRALAADRSPDPKPENEAPLLLGPGPSA